MKTPASEEDGWRREVNEDQFSGRKLDCLIALELSL